MKPAMKALIGIIVVGLAAYGGNIVMDKVQANKAAAPQEPTVAQVAPEVAVPMQMPVAPSLQQASPAALVEPAPVAVTPTTQETTNSGMSALLGSGKK